MTGVKQQIGDIAVQEGSLVKKEELFAFCWNVDNFSKIGNKSVISPLFKQVRGSKSDRSWQLKLCLMNDEYELEHLKVSLSLSSESTSSSVTADYQISIVDSDRRILLTQGSHVLREFRPVGGGWGLKKWIKTSDLESKGCLKNDILRIHCCITSQTELKHHPFDPEVDNDAAVVRKQIKSFLTRGEFSDITLKTASSSFPCSKIVLAGQSPVFYAMFTSGMLETQENVVKIEDFEDVVVKGMLEFLYSGYVDSLQDNVLDLLKIADKYQINGMQLMCAKVLVKELNVENAAETLILSDLHGPQSLKKNVISFIIRNRKAVQRTEGYILLKEHHKILLADLYIALEGSS